MEPLGINQLKKYIKQVIFKIRLNIKLQHLVDGATIQNTNILIQWFINNCKLTNDSDEHYRCYFAMLNIYNTINIKVSFVNFIIRQHSKYSFYNSINRFSSNHITQGSHIVVFVGNKSLDHITNYLFHEETFTQHLKKHLNNEIFQWFLNS